MKLAKVVLCASLVSVPLTVSPYNKVVALSCAVTESAPPTDFKLGQPYFIYTDSAGNEISNSYFTDTVVDIDPSQGVPANYIYEGMELAVFNKKTNAYMSYLGSVKESCMKSDLGNTVNYDPTGYYEIRYRVQYKVLGDEIQTVRSSWRTIGANGVFFKTSTPNPMDPTANPTANKSWVESKINSTYVIDDYSGTVNNLILTDKSSESVDIKSEAWYSSKIERTIVGFAKETASGNPTFKTDISKSDTLTNESGLNKKSYEVSMDLFGSDEPNIPKLTVQQTLDVAIIKDIFETLLDIKITQSGSSYSVTLSQKPSLTAEQKAVLDDSLVKYGVDLNRPYAYISEGGSNYVEDYADKQQLTLDTPISLASGAENPSLKIGYLGVNGKRGYTFTYPVKGLLSPKILGIVEGQTLTTAKSSYTPSLEVRGKSSIYRFPAQPTMNWDSFVNDGIKVDSFAKKVITGYVAPSDLATLFDTEPLNTATGPAQNTLDSMSLTESGQYIIGLRATNKFGEVAYDFKQFYLMLNGETKFLTVTNNANFEVDEKTIRYSDYKSVDHGMNLIVDGKISAKTAFNLAKQIIFLGTDSGNNPTAKLYNTDLQEYTAVDLSGLGMTQVKSVMPYQNGFLVAGTGGTNGLAYIDLSSNTIVPIDGLESEVYDILMDGQTLYVGAGSNLYAGKLEGTIYKTVSSIPNATLFGSATKIKSISKISDSLFVTPDSSGFAQTNVAIVSID